MEDSEEEEFLNLSLSVASDRERRKKKGKIIMSTREEENIASSMISSTSITSPTNTMMMNMYNKSLYEKSYEGKIFRLLQTRDNYMLRQDQQQHHDHGDGNNNNSNGLPLIHLLLTTAASIGDITSSLENLTELYKGASLTGDSVQRVVGYFADGLTARVLSRKSPFHDMIMEEPTAEEQFLAFTDLYKVSPYYQFAHFTANQAILEAFEREEEKNNRALHVIDFDVSYGFQWPSLIQSLSDKATSGNRISLRVTGFGKSLKELQETESRLVSFSKGFANLVFEFQGLLRGSRVINLRKKKNETVAVNLVSYLNTLGCVIKVSDTLGFVHSLNPSVVVLVEQEGGCSRISTSTHHDDPMMMRSNNFLSRLTDSLHYFAAMFDSLDDCLPLESSERLRIERKLLGKQIKGMLIDYYDHADDHHHHHHDGVGMMMEGGGDCPKYERMETWKARMETHGFGGTKVSSKALIQAKLLLKMSTHCCHPMQFDEDGGGGSGSGGGFKVSERDDGRAISLGWQNRFLLTVSAWQPV